MKNFDALFSAYNCNLSDEKVTENVSKIIADNYKKTEDQLRSSIL